MDPPQIHFRFLFGMACAIFRASIFYVDACAIVSTLRCVGWLEIAGCDNVDWFCVNTEVQKLRRPAAWTLFLFDIKSQKNQVLWGVHVEINH